MLSRLPHPWGLVHPLRGSARQLLICAGLSLAPLTANADLPPEALIDKVRAAARTLSFSGTYVHQQDSTLNTLRIYQLREGKVSLTKVQALEGRRQEVIRSPHETRVYFPDRQAVKLDQVKPIRPAFPDMFTADTADILRAYDLEKGESMRVADLETIELRLKPKDDLRWPVRMWVDKKSFLMLKCQKLDKSGNVIEQVAFSDLKYGPRPAASSLAPSFAGYREWPVHNASIEPLQPMPSLKFKPETLKGFSMAGVYQRSDAASPIGFSVRRYVLTDGLVTVSVFVQPQSVAGPLSDQVSRRGALSMLSRSVQDAWVTVMGEVPPDTIRNFAQSLEWKN